VGEIAEAGSSVADRTWVGERSNNVGVEGEG